MIIQVKEYQILVSFIIQVIIEDNIIVFLHQENQRFLYQTNLEQRDRVKVSKYA